MALRYEAHWRGGRPGPCSSVEHVKVGRTSKDSVTTPGVVELLGQLFAHGHPKFATNPGYPNQLVMLYDSYKAVELAARGESPVAALSYQLNPMPYLRLETAYWARCEESRGCFLTS